MGAGVAYVKGFRVENSGERSFEIDQITNTDVLNNQSIATAYGHYVKVTTVTGHVDIDWTPIDLQNSGGSKIGEAVAINVTPTRLYLANISMSGSIADLAKVSDGNGVIEVGNVLQSAANKALIFPSGLISTFDMTDTLIPVRTKAEVTHTGGAITITANSGEDFTCSNAKEDILVVEKTTNVFRAVSAVTVTNNNSELNITIDAGAASPVYVYYNKRLVGSANGIDSYNKIVREPYVKVNYSGNTTPANTKYSLGFPDVFEITEIKTLATGPGGIDEDFTGSFRLKRNQKDQFYDLSYIEYINGRPKPADGTGNLYIKMKVFECDGSTGGYFFNINSYPNTLNRNDIPVHLGDSGGQYNLRDSLDFRPHCNLDAAANYGATTTAAGIITASVGSYTPAFSGTFLVPALQSTILSDVESYLSRVDAIVFDSYGKSQIVKGEEAQNPITPKISDDQLMVSSIFIPGYPALTQKEASEQGKFSTAVQIKRGGTKNFTMRDIEKMERRIEGLEYYISLNQLEQSSENLLILDENGLSRFKNGYIVDPMNDTAIADTDDANFKAAIHFDKKILTPALNTFALDLKYSSSTGASIFPDVNSAEVASLSRDSNVKLIGQPYATNFRNCVSNFWKYDGNAQISPSHDMAHDTVQNPVPVEIDLAGVFQDLQEVLPITGINWDGPVTSGGSSSVTSGRTTTTITPRTQAGTISSLTVNDGGLDAVGDFITNVQFQPFMRSRNVKVYHVRSKT